MKARGRATGVASEARTGDPHGNHLHPKWSSVPPDHLGHEMARGPWCHRPLLRPCSRVGHFLFHLHVQLEVEGQMLNRYIGLKVLCGDTSTNVSGVIQWGVCRYPWLWEDGERLLFGE